MASAFESVIRLQMARFSPEEARRRHIEIARKGIAEFLGRQETPPEVHLEVDHQAAASEDQVRPYGVITYRLSRRAEYLRFARSEAMRMSPVDTGRYRDSWVVLADGQTDVTTLIEMNTAGEVLGVARYFVLTNYQPYSRRINLGLPGYERYAPPGVVERTKQTVLRRYRPLVDGRVEYLQLAGVPGAKPGKFRPITYPSLILTPKFL